MKYQINLISERKKKTTEKILYFVYHYLRYVIVITQIIVIFVFFNKIRYDQEIIDLQEIIAQQKEIIDISKPLAAEYLLIEKKTDKIAEIINSHNLLINQLNYLLSLFPKEITLTEMKFEKDSLFLTGQTFDPEIIKLFYFKLKEDKNFRTVSLEDIKKDAFSFSFTLKLSNFK